MAAVVTWRAAVINGSEDGFAHGDERDSHAVRSSVQDVFAAPPRKRGQIVFPCRHNLEPVVLAADADHLLNPLVVGFQFVVRQRPVFLDAVR